MRKLLPIFIITFLFYIAVSYYTTPFSNFDTQSYKEIGSMTLMGKSIYPDPAISQHPYLPFFLYFEAVTLTISLLLKIPQSLLIKIILSVFHLVSIYAVCILSKRNLKTSLLYALNPISLLIIAFHGQFDIIPITCLLFAIIALKNKQFIKTITLLSLAVAVKTWPVLFVIPFFKRIPKKHWYIFPLIPAFLLFFYCILFRSSPFSILRVLFVYQGVGGVWGLGWLLSFISSQKLFLLGYKLLFVAGLLFYSFKQKKQLILEELLELLLLFFIFTPGFGIQWFLWLVPFLFLSKKPMILLLIVPLFITLLVVYLSWTKYVAIPNNVLTYIFLAIYPLFIFYWGMMCMFPKKNQILSS